MISYIMMEINSTLHFNLLTQLGNQFEDSVYMKDLQGIYLYHNENMLKLLKSVKLIEPNQSSFIGKTDYELFPKKIADSFRNIDKNVLDTKKEHLTEELADFKQNIKRKFVTCKKPLFDLNDNVIGILGFTSDYTKIIIDNKNTVALTKREIQVLAGLYNGMSIREIADKLGLSPRTMEDYYTSLKSKLNCDSRKHLFELVNRLNFKCVLNYFYKNL